MEVKDTMIGKIDLKDLGRRRIRRVAAKKERADWSKKIRRRYRTIKVKQRRVARAGY